MSKHSASTNASQTNPFGLGNKPNAAIPITSAMSNTSTTAPSTFSNPFSKSFTSNSSNNAFLRPNNNQPIPLLGSTQTNQSQIIPNTGQSYGAQKTTSGFPNTNSPFGIPSNNSMIQGNSSSNPLNINKPNSNIFSNSTNNFQNSGNIYGPNPSGNTSPFGLSQSKTQLNVGANNTATSFKPIRTENAKLDPKHFVSCIAMEKKYLDQKLSKEEIRIGYYRMNQTNFNAMGNTFGNMNNQVKPTGIQFNQPNNNAFNQQGFGFGMNQQNNNGNVFGQQNIGNNVIQNPNIQINNGLFQQQQQQQQQNTFFPAAINNNTIPFMGTNNIFNNSFPAQQNFTSQPSNNFPSNIYDIIRNHPSVSAANQLGLYQTKSNVSQYLLSQIKNTGNLNKTAPLLTRTPPYAQNYLNPSAIQLLQGLQLFLNELYGTNFSLNDIAQHLFQGNLSHILDLYSRSLTQTPGLRLTNSSLFSPLTPYLFSPPKNTQFDNWMSDLDDYLLSDDQAYKQYLDSPCARLFGDDKSIKSIMSRNHPLRKKILDSRRFSNNIYCQQEQRINNPYFFCERNHQVNQQRWTQVVSRLIGKKGRDTLQHRVVSSNNSLSNSVVKNVTQDAQRLKEEYQKLFLKDEEQNDEDRIMVRPVQYKFDYQ